MKRLITVAILLTLMLTTMVLAAVSAPASITVYSSVDEENAKKILDAFTKSTGIPYKMVFLSSGPAIARIEAEKANPQADVWMGAPSQNLALGQAAVGIQFTPALLKAMDDGYPVTLVFPAEGVTYEAPAVSILKGAQNLEGAKSLVDWLVSLEGQNVIASSKTYFYPIHPSAKLAAGMPAFNEINTVEVDTIWAASEKTRIVNKWITEVLQSK